MSSTEFSWKNEQGWKIYAQDWAPPGKTVGAVALVHGLGEHTGRYRRVAEMLNQAGYALTGFDLPGHGQSEGSRGYASYDGILNDIDCLLREISQRYPGRPRFLYGHSLGGALVLYYTLKRRPELRGVVASSPGLAPGTRVSPATLLSAKVMARLAPAFRLNNGLDLTNLARDPAVIQAYTTDRLVHPYISARLGLDLITKGAWVQEHAAEFPLPLLLFRGSADRLVSAQAIATFVKAVPQARLTYKEWEGFYHETHNEPEKQQVLQYMIDWLNQHL
jgi:alpha-beta hydrolase superfamily lysophospholipase